MNKLQGKDLINVGIFTAIYFVVMMAIAMLGFIPYFSSASDRAGSADWRNRNDAVLF